MAAASSLTVTTPPDASQGGPSPPDPATTPPPSAPLDCLHDGKAPGQRDRRRPRTGTPRQPGYRPCRRLLDRRRRRLAHHRRRRPLPRRRRATNGRRQSCCLVESREDSPQWTYASGRAATARLAGRSMPERRLTEQKARALRGEPVDLRRSGEGVAGHGRPPKAQEPHPRTPAPISSTASPAARCGQSAARQADPTASRPAAERGGCELARLCGATGGRTRNPRIKEASFAWACRRPVASLAAVGRSQAPEPFSGTSSHHHGTREEYARTPDTLLCTGHAVPHRGPVWPSPLGRVSELAVDADGVQAASGKAEGAADTGVVSVDPRQRGRSPSGRRPAPPVSSEARPTSGRGRHGLKPEAAARVLIGSQDSFVPSAPAI